MWSQSPPLAAKILWIFSEKNEVTQLLGCFTSDIEIWSTYALLRSSMREVLALMMSVCLCTAEVPTFPPVQTWPRIFAFLWEWMSWVAVCEYACMTE